MYRCNWCNTKQKKDAGSVEHFDGDKIVGFGTCYKRCLYKRNTLGMTKMKKNNIGDWIDETV